MLSIYLQWNDALASQFFNPEMAGRPVYLYVTEELVSGLSRPLGADFAEFISAIKQGSPWSQREGFCFGESFETEPPFHLASKTAWIHLGWMVERSLLTVLGWSDSKSHVSPSFLSAHMSHYRGWQDHRKALTA